MKFTRPGLAGMCMMLAVAFFVFTGTELALAAGKSADNNAVDLALRYLERNKHDFGLTGSDISDVVVSSTSTSTHNGVTHVYFQQRYRGIEVWNAIANISVKADGTVIAANSTFTANIVSLAGGNAKKVAREAAAAAAQHLKLKPTKPFTELQRRGGPSEAVVLSDGGISVKPIEAKLVWLPVNNKVRLAWNLEIEEVGGDHWWNAFIDAETGESLGQVDLIDHDNAQAIAAAIARPPVLKAALPKMFAMPLPVFPATDGASYRVFPLPFESPSDGDRSLISNPASPAASPFGWHDTNGVGGPEFTITRGNNVHAYADRNADNVADLGSSPDGGASLTFDFTLDLTRRPFDSQPAMVTNLFYWNNIMHDVTYGYGFDEASGNFQVTNYTGAVGGGDDVRAEAQDGSGRNNANFGTAAQNAVNPRSRMQMFEWRSSAPNPIVVAAPSPIAGTYFGPMAGFGESLVTTGPISGQLVYVGRGCDPVYQPTTPPTPPIPFDPYLADPAGKIALVDRGICTFVAKVKKAQDLGALSVIVANNIAGAPTAMGGADPTITIPSVMISQADGDLFKPNLPVNATISDGTGGVPDRDSDLDAGVISHEYGHGVSNRLTGGPNNVACLRNAEQMGEGWSDWFALNLTTHPSDTLTTRRGVGTYVNFEPPDGLGIRPTPYTTDITVNPSTYASVADTVNISEPHGIGYVWNTMLWEMYWNLVDRYGYNANIYGSWSTGGNNLALQLVMDGMKFQPCSPGFVDGRNAILTADIALTGGTNQCEIWRAFAKRGLGSGANQGLSTNRTDGVAAFDLPASCRAATFGGFRAPVKSDSVNNWTAGDVVPVRFQLTGDDSTMQIDSQPVNCSTQEPTGEAPTLVQFAGGTGLKKKAKEFQFSWQTNASWAGSCRRLTVRIPGVSDGKAFFSFE